MKRRNKLETELSDEEDIVSWIVDEALIKHPTKTKTARK